MQLWVTMCVIAKLYGFVHTCSYNFMYQCLFFNKMLLYNTCLVVINIFTRLKTAKRLFRNVHRKTVELYFVSLYNEIDKAAEINQSQFWRLVNAKRNVSERCPGSEFIFNSRVWHDTDSILRGWHDYFKDLYHKDNSNHFDKHFEKRFHQRLLHFILTELPLTMAYLIPAFLFSLLKALLNL